MVLSRRCKPRLVARRLIKVLSAFNGGHARDFARAFMTPVSFQPYNDTPLAPEGSVTSALTREEIAHFVDSRHAAGDAWVARALQPPLGDAGLPRKAVYGLELQITVNGELFPSRFAKVVVECRSGLIQAWVGPLVHVAR